MSAQKVFTQRNRMKQPQYVVEGKTPATFGLLPTNPVFSAIGCNTIIDDGSSPITAEQRQSGDLDRKRKDKIATNAPMTLKMQMTLSDLSLLQWALTKPEDPYIDDSPDESRYFTDSYRDIDDVQIYRRFIGCKPTGWNFSEDRLGYRTLEIPCICKQILEDATPPDIGTGSFAVANPNPPYTHKDAGVSPFLYNGEGFSSANFISSGTLPQAPQDAIGSEDTLFTVPSQRVINGSISIFKKNEELQALAKSVDFSDDAVYTFDSAEALSIALTNFLWLPSNEELSGDSSAATMENKSYEANSVEVIDA